MAVPKAFAVLLSAPLSASAVPFRVGHAGRCPAEVKVSLIAPIFERIHTIRREHDLTILLVEQRVAEALDCCHRLRS